MANAIELITKQLPLLDQAVKLGMRTSCLETNSAFVRETADALANEIGADVVQVIGSKIVLYRENKENKQIYLVK